MHKLIRFLVIGSRFSTLRQICIRAGAASPSKLETVGSEPARAIAAFRSRGVAFGTDCGNDWLQHVQLLGWQTVAVADRCSRTCSSSA